MLRKRLILLLIFCVCLCACDSAYKVSLTEEQKLKEYTLDILDEQSADAALLSHKVSLVNKPYNTKEGKNEKYYSVTGEALIKGEHLTFDHIVNNDINKPKTLAFKLNDKLVKGYETEEPFSFVRTGLIIFLVISLLFIGAIFMVNTMRSQPVNHARYAVVLVFVLLVCAVSLLVIR